MPNRAGLDLIAEVKRNGVVTAVASRATVPTEALRAAGDWLRARQDHVFRTSNRGQWSPDDPATVQLKGSARPLIDNGGLLASFTNPSAPGAEHRYGTDSVTVASSLVQAIMATRRGSDRDPAPDLTRSEATEVAQLVLGVITGQDR